MVALWRGEAGKVKLGCLLMIAILVVAVIVAKDFGAVYLKYYQMQDEVKAEGAFAPGLSDAVIRDRLAARADSLGIPLARDAWFVRRTHGPNEITIRGEYWDSVVFQVFGYRKVVYMHLVPSTVAPF